MLLLIYFAFLRKKNLIKNFIYRNYDDYNDDE